MSTGYIFRYISMKDPSNLGPFVIQTLFIILPPSLYAATIYMLYGRIVRLVDAAHLSLIRPTWVTKIFVASDAFAFILQVGGGSMLTMDGKEKLGKEEHHWTTMMKVMYFGAALIIFRCVFRVIEFTADRNSAVRKNEIFTYCFDAAPMLVVQSIFHVFHGGMVLPLGRVPAKMERFGEGDSQYELSRGV